MSMPTKKRNTIIAAAIAGAVLLIAVIILLARGCAGEEEPAVSTGTTGTTRTATTPTVTTEPSVEIVSQSVSPTQATEGDALSFTVTVKGDAAGVTLVDELGPASSGGDFTPVFSQQMTEGSTSGGIATWTLSATASKQGRHRFYAIATTAGGEKIQAAGEPPTYVVSPAQSPSPQPAPSQQPLSIIMQSASPETLSDGQPIHFTVKVSGTATSVIMNWHPVGSDPGSNRVLPLYQTGSEPGGVTVWEGSMDGDASICSMQCGYVAEAFGTTGSDGQINPTYFQIAGNWSDYTFTVVNSP